MRDVPDRGHHPESGNRENELRDFLKKIFELDQSTPHRSNAEECYQRLLSRQDEFVRSAIESEYWNALSLVLFHMGQIEAHNENSEKARDHFAKSSEAATKGFSDEWRAYVEGTIHYLDNDPASLEQVMHNADDNIQVLQRFLSGLKKRGAPNYKEDY